MRAISPSDVSAGSLTASEVEELTRILTRHHNEPVMPVSRYCDAFSKWAGALAERATRETDGDKHFRDANLDAIAKLALTIELAIRKSNLLYRLIYAGQPIRTQMCPIHKGHWSGYGHGGHPCECQDGYDITGWLPTHELSLGARVALFAKHKGLEPVQCATHFPASPDYVEGFPCTATCGKYHTRAAAVDQAIEALAGILAEKEGFKP